MSGKAPGNAHFMNSGKKSRPDVSRIGFLSWRNFCILSGFIL